MNSMNDLSDTLYIIFEYCDMKSKVALLSTSKPIRNELIPITKDIIEKEKHKVEKEKMYNRITHFVRDVHVDKEAIYALLQQYHLLKNINIRDIASIGELYISRFKHTTFHALCKEYLERYETYDEQRLFLLQLKYFYCDHPFVNKLAYIIKEMYKEKGRFLYIGD
jgi:hypothetical protein